MSGKCVVIVGGGITGLSMAYALEKRLPPDVGIWLFEKGKRVGGNIVTERHSGFVLDGGPDSWIAQKPHATKLAEELGLASDLVGTNPRTRHVYVLSNRELHRVPEGFILGIPTEVSPLLWSGLFSWDAKVRMGLEVLVPRKIPAPGEDESIGSFMRRRLGDDVTDLLVGPLLGGIYAGDPDSLSLASTFPKLLEAEEKHGSLIRAMRAEKAIRDAARKRRGDDREAPSVFLSLKDGLGDLVRTLLHRLKRTEVASDDSVVRIERSGTGYRVVTTSGSMFADVVALCVPAHALTKVLDGFSDEAVLAASGIDYVSTATVHLAYPTYQIRHPLDGVGFLVPKSEGRHMLACTWVSSKWDRRAPSNSSLLRVFFGGHGKEADLERDDDALVQLARSEIGGLLGITHKPALSRVFRFHKASPQPTVGHAARVARLRAAIEGSPGLYLAGNGYDGTGIPDCVKQAQAAAGAVEGYLRERTRLLAGNRDL